MNVIKGRLESVTFGGIVTRWITIPDELVVESDDSELYNNVVGYVLGESGYEPYINEEFELHLKL